VTAPEHPRVLAVFGPTAVGKTAVALALARRLRDGGARPVAVSADALQVYRGLETLTGVASAAERAALEHRLVSCLPVSESFSAGAVARLAHAEIDELLAQGATPIVVGGTGLYLRAALADLDLPPAPEPGARERWERFYDRLGPEQAYAALADRDPDAARALHPNDRRRVVRALELHEAGGSLAPPRNRLWTVEARRPTRIFGLDLPKDVLEERIQARTEAMFARGVEAEVRRARERTLSKTAAQIIGLQEVAELPRDAAIAEIVLRTRQVAAYQRKWMRRIPGLVLIQANRDPESVAAAILVALRA
jgi:tRNA dimethylallyltransferase